MPLYTFRCETCEKTQDEVKSINDDSTPICSCGGQTKKIITGCNFVLKGGGWGRDLTEKKEREKRSEKLKAKTEERAHYKDFG